MKKQYILGCIELSRKENKVLAMPSIASYGSIDGMQLTLCCGGAATMESHLTMASAHLIHSCSLPFSLANNAKFQNILMLARNVSMKCQPPGRNQVSLNLLNMNYNAVWRRTCNLLEKEVDCILGDSAIIHKMPFLNILSSIHSLQHILRLLLVPNI